MVNLSLTPGPPHFHRKGGAWELQKQDLLSGHSSDSAANFLCYRSARRAAARATEQVWMTAAILYELNLQDLVLAPPGARSAS